MKGVNVCRYRVCSQHINYYRVYAYDKTFLHAKHQVNFYMASTGNAKQMCLGIKNNFFLHVINLIIFKGVR